MQERWGVRPTPLPCSHPRLPRPLQWPLTFHASAGLDLLPSRLAGHGLRRDRRDRRLGPPQPAVTGPRDVTIVLAPSPASSSPTGPCVVQERFATSPPARPSASPSPSPSSTSSAPTAWPRSSTSGSDRDHPRPSPRSAPPIRPAEDRRRQPRPEDRHGMGRRRERCGAAAAERSPPSGACIASGPATTPSPVGRDSAAGVRHPPAVAVPGRPSQRRRHGATGRAASRSGTTATGPWRSGTRCRTSPMCCSCTALRSLGDAVTGNDDASAAVPCRRPPLRRPPPPSRLDLTAGPPTAGSRCGSGSAVTR